MAAIALPLIGALAPSIIDLIASIVHPKVVEASAGGSTGTGPVLFADVFAGAMTDLIKAHANGAITVLPDEATVKVVIQSVFVALKLSGVLAGATPSPQTVSAGTQTIMLRPGSVLTIQAAATA